MEMNNGATQLRGHGGERDIFFVLSPPSASELFLMCFSGHIWSPDSTRLRRRHDARLHRAESQLAAFVSDQRSAVRYGRFQKRCEVTQIC